MLGPADAGRHIDRRQPQCLAFQHPDAPGMRRAIIAKAADSQPFNDVRAKLLLKIALPTGTKLPPDITHCSLARFNTVLDVESIRSLAGAIAIGFTEHVSDFKLLKGLGPPRFNPTTMQTYRLHTF